jgi:import inner membrane translocase subunit TIM13
MAIWGSSSSNTASSGEADIKTHLMNQVRQEAAVTNARNLIGVCTDLTYHTAHGIKSI